MNYNQFQSVRKKCILETKRKIKESVNDDNLIIQAVSSVEELDLLINKAVTRLREWYELYNPEFSDSIGNNEKFVEIILQKDKHALLREMDIRESMGKDLKGDDLNAVMDLAKGANALIQLRENEKRYIDSVLVRHCPNTKAVLGSALAGKILRHAGSLRKLAITPAPVIQIMGAEKAMFDHLKKKTKCPKHGLIFAHPLIAKVKRKDHGKIARAIADKTAIAARVDFFEGKSIGEKLRQEIEDKAAALK